MSPTLPTLLCDRSKRDWRTQKQSPPNARPLHLLQRIWGRYTMINLTQLSIATAIAGATAVAVVAIPLYYHTPRREPLTQVMAWRWPDELLSPPSQSPNAIAEIAIPLPPLSEARKVKVERYIAETIVPKIIDRAPPNSEVVSPKGEGTPIQHRNVCQKDGGYKVETHHGRSWHCVYPRATREKEPRRHARHRRRR